MVGSIREEPRRNARGVKVDRLRALEEVTGGVTITNGESVLTGQLYFLDAKTSRREGLSGPGHYLQSDKRYVQLLVKKINEVDVEKRRISYSGALG